MANAVNRSVTCKRAKAWATIPINIVISSSGMANKQQTIDQVTEANCYRHIVWHSCTLRGARLRTLLQPQRFRHKAMALCFGAA